MTDDPRVLVACPTFFDKEYAIYKWVSAYTALNYSQKDAFLVDNTPETLDYQRIVRFLGIKCDYQTPMANWWDTFDLCWTKIIEYAHTHGFEFILSLEQDVIAPPNTIEVMLTASGADKAVVTHRYRPRDHDNCWYETLGCCLFPTELMYPQLYTLPFRFEIGLFNHIREIKYPLVRLAEVLQLTHMIEPREDLAE